MDQVNIVQWNAQSLISSKQLLTQFLYDNNIHVALISETWLKSHHRFNIRGYTIERNDLGNKHNGVAILIRNSIDYTKIDTDFDDCLQNICVRIKIRDKDISLVSFSVLKIVILPLIKISLMHWCNLFRVLFYFVETLKPITSHGGAMKPMPGVEMC